jgi:hypothetical protein
MKNNTNKKASKTSKKAGALKTPSSIVVKVDSNKVALSKELLKAGSKLKPSEGRFLVDRYYQLQDDRIKSEGQLRSLYKGEEWPDYIKEALKNPATILEWMHTINMQLEEEIKKALKKFAENNFMGKWAMEQCGIGPVLSAGLLVHLEIEQAPTAGHLWSYAGFDPTREWKKGEKRPFNAKLKTLCFKIGESFVKVKSRDQDIYGKIYQDRKALEMSRNKQGLFAEQAKEMAKKFKANKSVSYDWYSGKVTTEAYKEFLKKKEASSLAKPKTVGEGEGIHMLPPGHIHARARRYAVKMLLSDWHEIAYQDHYKKERPLPFPVAHLGHAHVRKAALPKWETNDPYWEDIIKGEATDPANDTGSDQCGPIEPALEEAVNANESYEGK